MGLLDRWGCWTGGAARKVGLLDKWGCCTSGATGAFLAVTGTASTVLAAASTASTVLAAVGIASTVLAAAGTASTVLAAAGTASTVLAPAGTASTVLATAGTASTVLATAGAASTVLTAAGAAMTVLAVLGQLFPSGATGFGSGGGGFQVAVSGQVVVSGLVAASCSCPSLAHLPVLWHHRLGHPSLPRLRSMASHSLVSGLPRVFLSLPPSLAQPCTLCVAGRLRATPHSSLRPATVPFQTLHLDSEATSTLIRWLLATESTR
ncbi:unnamed protein product, partial [Closterium sp. NIES-53]